MEIGKVMSEAIEVEVTKQLVNRGIASKSWVNATVNEMLENPFQQYANGLVGMVPDLQQRITTLEIQVKKLFAKLDTIREIPSDHTNAENHGKKWTDQEKARLRVGLRGLVHASAKTHKRTNLAILCQLKRLIEEEL